MKFNSYIHTIIHPFFTKWFYGCLKILFIFSILSFSACDKPKIPEDTLVKIYADIVIAQDTTTGSSLKTADINTKVFKKYNVTADDYKKSIQRMESDQELWESFFNKVVAHVENLKKKEIKK